MSDAGLDALVAAHVGPGARPLYLTGAGISLASGIPTFRGADPGAIWATDVLEMATGRHFRRDPVEHWSWYLHRFHAARHARPNPAHAALVDVEQRVTRAGGRFLLVTQNIDGLHAMAGSANLVEVHGQARKLRCARRGCANGAPRGSLPFHESLFDSFREEPRREAIPACAVCGELLRPHVLYFDEYYTEHEDYGFDRARRAFWEASVVVFVGTSFSVGITEMALEAVIARGLPCWVVDPHLVEAPIESARVVREPAEVVLPELARRLDALGGSPA